MKTPKLENISYKTFLYIVIAMVALSLLATVVVEFMYANKYSIQVKAIKPQKKIGINPLTTSLDFGDVPLGGKAKRFITLSNNGNRSSYIITWRSGGIGELVTINKNYFNLRADRKEKVTVLLKIPPSARPGYYRGTVYIFRLPKLF